MTVVSMEKFCIPLYLYTRVKALVCNQSIKDFVYHNSLCGPERSHTEWNLTNKRSGNIFSQYTYFQLYNIILGKTLTSVNNLFKHDDVPSFVYT